MKPNYLILTPIAIFLILLSACKNEDEIASLKTTATAIDDVAAQNTTLSALSGGLVTTYKGLTITFSNNSSIGTISRPTTGFTSVPSPAYDYSVDLVRDVAAQTIRLFHGGRFKDAMSDGDHTLARKVSYAGSANIANWQSSSSWISPPLYPSGTELPRGLWRQPEDVPGGNPNAWDAGNYMDPEVIKVGGVYYQFTQCEITGSRNVDGSPTVSPGSGVWADRIQLYTSTSGEGGWTKYLPGGVNRGVITNIPAAERSTRKFGHHEMMYEAGAAKPWVMYVYSHLNNVPKGYFRIKSTTPHTFDWSTAQLCSGFSQLGNKTGYVDVPGGRLYMRISHTANSAGKRVPTFRFSSDGLNFDDGSAIVELIGHPSLNTYFLGFTTDYGTGANAPLTTGGTQFSFQYGGAASTSAVAPDIFNSDIWLGKTNMTVTGTLVP
ncbi:hypothetical protein [Pedobacter heparinus]|uniref:DUF4185 domain-containing protein n=1 Tax=Pedobacter heparinus (strain ATCC 13125 / DSM 2366 / CIP 104194 / JCM 7457 / NBRC 12017 / NCIMB 9290 / NRRL B-14731 / HIM 762-3) TaxID=485917 RepID=C6XYL5_PEDHD|nr:hypothetical protein [Pedobacter heparinus]ACU04497.1 hypothetical protein Phep_2293 [Pedobacter heparinus DSM 2366]